MTRIGDGGLVIVRHNGFEFCNKISKGTDSGEGIYDFYKDSKGCMQVTGSRRRGWWW